MAKPFKACLCQIDSKFGDTEANVSKVIACMKEAAANGAVVMLFPECALQGYCYDSPEEVVKYSVPADGPDIARIAAAAKELNVYVCFGFTEDRKGKYYNSAALVGPNGIEHIYSKMHMPYIGLDKFAEKGQPPVPPIETPYGRFGIVICYDIRFPELARYYFAQGADVILQPTNWPLGSEYTRDVLPLARAFENNYYWLACNRVGEEKGSHFIGGARAVGPNGRIIVQASEEHEEMLYVDIDADKARQKHFFSVEGNWSIDVDKDRRPEVFGDPGKLLQ